MAEPIDNVRFAMEGEVLALHPAPSNDMALNSIAISLKRIADALAGTAEKRSLTEVLLGIEEAVDQLAQKAWKDDE